MIAVSAGEVRADVDSERSWAVIAGTLVHGGEELPRLSCRFVTAGERECEMETGPGGVALLALQFPALERTGTR